MNAQKANPKNPEDKRPFTTRMRRLFDAYRSDGEETVEPRCLTDLLERAGLRRDDPRLAETFVSLDAVRRDARLDLADFAAAVGSALPLLEKALEGRLVIPEFQEFREAISSIHDRVRPETNGSLADYIPQLARVDPDLFGLGLCTVDGQRMGLGDHDQSFCVQSACKPLGYAVALEDRGEDLVHRHVGCEPSGRSFNELTLNPRGLPHNPLINAGAIISCSLIRPDLVPADRFEHLRRHWTEASGGVEPGFDNCTYLSERKTADRNFALGYSMRESGAFPEGVDLVETLEFYFQCCSLELDAAAMGVVAATLANGGVCPLTGRRVFSVNTVQHCLSMMYSCGMYDFSGEWGFRIGLPAKSGVSGAILVVVPNVLGFCVFSPRLDSLGNSVRGISFCRELVKTFNFHNYDSIVGGRHEKIDPRIPSDTARSERLEELLWACSRGDVDAIRRSVARGANLMEADYDGRTALHLAASEGHLSAVSFLIDHGADLEARDRWGGTAIDDAIRENHEEVAALLLAAGTRDRTQPEDSRTPPVSESDSQGDDELVAVDLDVLE